MIHIQDGPLGLDDPNRRVFAGVWDTKNAASVQFDVSDWLAAWPGGTLHILVQRPGDEYPYPAQSVQISDGVAEWTFDAVDTAYAGVGSCALVYELGEDVRARTEPYDLLIAPTIGPADDDPPDPLQRWYDDMLLAADRAESAAADAEAAKGAAQTAAGAAAQSEANAAASASNAAASASGAGSAKTAAEAARNAAQTAAGAAAQSASNAAASETNAAASATAAGNAETAAEVAQAAAEAAQAAAEAAVERLDPDEVERRILAAFPTDSVSNQAVASFPDGADGIPVQSLSADLTGAGYAFAPDVYINPNDSFKAAWYGNPLPRTIVVPCEGGKTYTVTTGLSSTLRVASFPAYPSPGDTPTAYNTATGTTVTLMTGADDAFILVQLFVNAEASNTAFATAIAGFSIKDEDNNTPSWATIRVHRVGKNLINRSVLMLGMWGSSGDPGGSTNGRYHSLFIPVTGGASYAWSASNGYTGGRIFTVWFDANGVELSRSPLNSGTTSVVVEAPANAAYASVSVYLPSNQAWCQFERGDAVSAYEAYSAQTVTLTIADGTTDAALTTALGNNDIYADAGTVSMTYRADPTLYVKKQITGQPHETWTFTLSDSSTVDKDVVLWQST